MIDTINFYRRILSALERDNMTMGSLIEVTGIPYIRFNPLIRNLFYLGYVKTYNNMNRSKFDRYHTNKKITLTPKGIMLLDKINNLYSLIGE